MILTSIEELNGHTWFQIMSGFPGLSREFLYKVLLKQERHEFLLLKCWPGDKRDKYGPWGPEHLRLK